MTFRGRHHAAQKQSTKTSLARGAGTLTMAGAVALGTFGLGAPAAQADSVWDRVAACESGGDWDINTGNSFYGGLQFTKSTWAGYGGTQYAPTADLATKSQQIQIAKRTLDGQGPGAWPECSVEAGLTRSNGDSSASRGSERAAAPTEESEPAEESAPAEEPVQESAPAEEPVQKSAPAEQATSPAPVQESGPVTRYVNADISAYVRSGASYDNGVIDQVSRGTEVTGPMVNGWLKIGEGRYIGNSVLSSSPVGGGSSAESGTVTRYVSADTAAYVRSGGSYDNGVIDKVDRGTEVTGTMENGWLKIGEGRYIGNTMLSASSL